MYAIVEIAGKQFRVEQNSTVRVPRLEGEVGATVTFDKVLLHAGDQIRVGAPYLNAAKVSASVVGHGREDTILVFKKKKRKSYRVTRGHRQQYTDIQVQSITA